MFKRIILYLILLNLCLENTPAQEVITGLRSNPRIINRTEYRRASRALNVNDTLSLPFFDDFSGHSVFPDSTKWTDDFIFVNNTYSDSQITAGIATFDALDNTGKLYSDASVSGFEADHLTSQPINLNYTPADNIFLSFFYQAGGLSDAPEAQDSLTLQFYASGEQKWYSVWSVPGSLDKRFKPAIIRIDNDRFLQKGFQFRFINYASLSPNISDPSMVGNCDIWNVDYVLLNKNRNQADTVFADVALTLPLRSLLKTHEAMPWKQFKHVSLQEMGSAIPVHYRNNDTITRNITRNFEIRDVYNNTVAYSFSAGATDIAPLTSIDYDANLVYTYNSPNNDSALFRITASLKTDNFDPKQNDTLIYYQHFQNYFAFDDGTSEGGYGINGLGSRNAMVGYRFESYYPDTLRAIRICFNDSYMESNFRSFDLMVWDDNNGIPGNILYTFPDVTVQQGNMINGFYEYTLPEGVVVNGTFYVGWRQISETFLNVGYDVNTPNTGRQFYWLNGDWSQSQVAGTIMIRPVVGTVVKITSVHETPSGKKNLMNLWPNPATDHININPGDLELHGNSYIAITDLNGRELMNLPFSEQVDISSLHDGMYILVIKIKGIPVGYNRFIKLR
jgi:Secretion system C-terminal sorting domain